MLTTADFAQYFEDVHGVQPFPWQTALVQRVADEGRWPELLDLPTGAGKTAALDIAVFHLALEAAQGPRRKAPLRMAFVVDRRIIVDDAYARALRIADALQRADTPATRAVADALGQFSGRESPPLIARRLRGGMPREDDWARSPAQPTILCSTVDQVGSRLLFRGYGVSDSMKPIHAGLLGADCLILLDEAHLAEPFRQTLDWVRTYSGARWVETDGARPCSYSVLTATPGAGQGSPFGLSEADRTHPVLRARLQAPKPARLVLGTTSRAGDHDRSSDLVDAATRTDLVCAEVMKALAHSSSAADPPAIGVVVNRVQRARDVFQQLRGKLPDVDVHLLIGPSRAVDRDDIVAEVLSPIRTGAERTFQRPMVLVATQSIEAGVDIDLDGLITEIAPLDALRQRFGRLNRAGRPMTPYASIVALKSDIGARSNDPIYGGAARATWNLLIEHAEDGAGEKTVDFGISAFSIPQKAECLSPSSDAPVLLPAHVDLLAQTSPIPKADPDVALFLHGPNRQPDAVSLVWRADIDGSADDARRIRQLLTLVPPRTGESISLPVWTVRRWLGNGSDLSLRNLGDVAGNEPDDDTQAGEPRSAFRWRGDDDRSEWIPPSAIRPGDVLVVPASYGGVDEYGWNPRLTEAATDVASAAAMAFADRYFAVRVHPSLDDAFNPGTIARVHGMTPDRALEFLLEQDVAHETRQFLEHIRDRRRGRLRMVWDAYATIGNVPQGVMIIAAQGLRSDSRVDSGGAATTEDDLAGSVPGVAVRLNDHARHVAEEAVYLAEAAALPADRCRDIQVAAQLHDVGKSDPRFQTWLYSGDPLGFGSDVNAPPLAKSGRTLPPTARLRSGLPPSWRHEALSVRMAPVLQPFDEAADAELVLWLIGTHHGQGRPLFPHADPADATERLLHLGESAVSLPAGAGPQSLNYDWDGMDWPTLAARLRSRYGAWNLALMEAVLRLADHRASRREAAGEE